MNLYDPDIRTIRSCDQQQFMQFCQDKSFTHLISATSNRLLKKIITPGDAKDKCPEREASATIQFKEWLLDGTQINTPIKEDIFEFHCGWSQINKGWEEGTQSMCVGETALFYVHPDLAYGQFGFADFNIPAAAVIKVIITLVSTKKDETGDNYDLTEERIQHAYERQVEGNEYFKKQLWSRAKMKYETGAKLLMMSKLGDPQSLLSEMERLRAILYANEMACYLQMYNYEWVQKQGKEFFDVLKDKGFLTRGDDSELEDIKAKVYGRLIKALVGQKKYDEAVKTGKKGLMSVNIIDSKEKADYRKTIIQKEMDRAIQLQESEYAVVRKGVYEQVMK